VSTSGTRIFNPLLADFMSEALSRLQIRGVQITEEHITESVASANYMLAEWMGKGVNQFQLRQVDVALTATEPTYTLAAGTIDVWSAVFRRENRDTPVWPISRSDYESIPDKTNGGDRPIHCFVDKSTNTRTVTLWPVPTRGDTLRLWTWVRADDQTGIDENGSITFEWQEAYASEMCARLAEKFRPSAYTEKRALADSKFVLAQRGQRERAPTRIRARGYRR
jgi:hypothetical protein